MTTCDIAKLANRRPSLCVSFQKVHAVTCSNDGCHSSSAVYYLVHKLKFWSCATTTLVNSCNTPSIVYFMHGLLLGWRYPGLALSPRLPLMNRNVILERSQMPPNLNSNQYTTTRHVLISFSTSTSLKTLRGIITMFEGDIEKTKTTIFQLLLVHFIVKNPHLVIAFGVCEFFIK